jgi:hypothetical protein
MPLRTGLRISPITWHLYNESSGWLFGPQAQIFVPAISKVRYWEAANTPWGLCQLAAPPRSRNPSPWEPRTDSIHGPLCLIAKCRHSFASTPRLTRLRTKDSREDRAHRFAKRTLVRRGVIAMLRQGCRLFRRGGLRRLDFERCPRPQLLDGLLLVEGGE